MVAKALDLLCWPLALVDGSTMRHAWRVAAHAPSYQGHHLWSLLSLEEKLLPRLAGQADALAICLLRLFSIACSRHDVPICGIGVRNHDFSPGFEVAEVDVLENAWMRAPLHARPARRIHRQVLARGHGGALHFRAGPSVQAHDEALVAARGPEKAPAPPSLRRGDTTRDGAELKEATLDRSLHKGNRLRQTVLQEVEKSNVAMLEQGCQGQHQHCRIGEKD
mmetsp:Transcript_1608/g.2429  ORF Transcript_1608/g.2429 Transcript_1608/m.2429 type:complete len:222 (+) Transcript_1608:641-1306(+)